MWWDLKAFTGPKQAGKSKMLWKSMLVSQTSSILKWWIAISIKSLSVGRYTINQRQTYVMFTKSRFCEHWGTTLCHWLNWPIFTNLATIFDTSLPMMPKFHEVSTCWSTVYSSSRKNTKYLCWRCDKSDDFRTAFPGVLDFSDFWGSWFHIQSIFSSTGCYEFSQLAAKMQTKWNCGPHKGQGK